MRTHIEGCGCPHAVHVCRMPIEMASVMLSAAIEGMYQDARERKITPRRVLRHASSIRWSRAQLANAIKVDSGF